jgi:cytochrome o ubiquinol oxidase subunit II
MGLFRPARIVTELNLQADQTDTLLGLSSHFGNDGFADMRDAVRAVSADEFAAWLARARSCPLSSS